METPLVIRALVALALALCSALPASAQRPGRWIRAESPGFVVFSTSSETRVRGLVADLESFDALLRRMTEAPTERSPTKLEVYVFAGPGQFRETFPSLTQSARGVYVADADLIAAFAIFRDARGLEAQDVLFHEYAHHFMLQYFANAYPVWYIEGFAEFVMTAEFEANRIVLGRSAAARAAWLFSGAWLPMEQLLEGRPNRLDSDDTARFYAQSWLFTHYLFNTPGKMAQFRVYVRALRLGATPAEAFQTGFGMTPSQMQSELRTYLNASPDALALTRPAAVAHDAANVTRLPPSADMLLPIDVRLRRGGIDTESVADLLGRVRRLAGDESRDRFALITLARAEATIGEVSRARALLAPYLEAQPDDPEAHYLLGYTYLREARAIKEDGNIAAPLYTQARRHFARANRIDDDSFQILYRYAETFSGSLPDENTSDNVMNILLLAHQLAPQVDEISLYTARVLMHEARPATAIPILRAMSHNPHGGGTHEIVRNLLAEAEESLRNATAEAAAP